MDQITIPTFLHPLIQTIMTPLVGNQCTAQLINVPILQYSKYCITHITSKGLGYGIIVSGSLFKVPQILKLISTQSTQGVSEIAHVLESIASSIFVSYNYNLDYPFSTYGEAGFIVVQNLIILMIMHVLHGRSIIHQTIFLSGYTGSVYLLLGVVPFVYIQVLQTCAVLISVTAKVLTLRSILVSKNSRGVSLITLGMYLLGSCARVFTSMHETQGDYLLLSTFVLNGVLNLMLVCTAKYYQSAAGVIKKKMKSQKKTPPPQTDTPKLKQKTN